MESSKGLSLHVLTHAHFALALPLGQYIVLAVFVIVSPLVGPKTLALATGAKVLPTSRTVPFRSIRKALVTVTRFLGS